MGILPTPGNSDSPQTPTEHPTIQFNSDTIYQGAHSTDHTDCCYLCLELPCSLGGGEEGGTLPAPLHAQQPEAPRTTPSPTCTEASFCRHDGLQRWPLVTDSTSKTSLVPGLKLPPSTDLVGSPGKQHPHSDYLGHKLRCGGKALL